MKKIITLFAFAIIVYLFLRFFMHDFILGHNLNYKIKTKNDVFQINEILNLKNKQGIDNYYFKIKHKNDQFEFKITNKFNKEMHIIKDIKYYKDKNYTCILPVFKKDDEIIDMMCYYKKSMYYYHNLPEKTNEIIKFAEKTYNYKKWVDNKNDIKISKSLKIFKNNIIENHYLIVDNYQGISIINDKINNIKLFKDDVYESKIKTLVNDKYIIANYNKKYDFNSFYIVDITKNKYKETIVNQDINFNSYINGVKDDMIFITDKDMKIQYKYDIKNNNLSIVGDKKTGIIAYDNELEKNISMTKAISSEYKFKTSTKNKNYDRIDKINGNYYFYKKENNYYNVYKAPLENKNKMIYLFKTDNIDEIYYKEDYIYYKLENKIKYYNEQKGSKTLLENSEFEFNDSLKYYIYVEG